VRISSWPGYSRVQSGFCSKEKLYRFDQTSQQQPGYLLSYQVPPMPEDFSRMMKFWQELRLMRSIAVQRPKEWRLACSEGELTEQLPIFTGYSRADNYDGRTSVVEVAHGDFWPWFIAGHS